ncbi:MAG TPA: hypothetical protein VFR38_13975 [Gaiellaceae bacterium]|nr:hypothetical protein [Gaiellaceae bacterium]
MSRTTLLVFIVVVLGLTTALMAYATRDGSGGSRRATIPQPTAAQLEAAYLGKLPVASESKRVDVVAPTFSDPTTITNPLFPISDLHSVVLNGRVDGMPFHTETTLLPETRIIEWTEGQQVETRISQYVAYLDGRIEEVALDYYAQADDGSVWYFGEDVFNYEDGHVADTDGTWLAGKDGPPAMIMPGDPHVGDVYRPENVPGLVFEEVTVKAVNKQVAGPRGPVEGAIVAGELHQDGSRESKTFAPGYGEFFTSSGGDLEALALAVPTDALDGPVPGELEALSVSAHAAFAAVRASDWRAASASLGKLDADWRSYRSGQVPPRIAAEMASAIKDLDRAVAARDRVHASTAAIDVSQSALELELRHRPPAEIDRARFELWARQLVVDAFAGDAGGVLGDLATLEWIRDRFATTIDKVDLTRIDAQLVGLRGALNDDDLRAIAARADRLRATLARISAG